MFDVHINFKISLALLMPCGRAEEILCMPSGNALIELFFRISVGKSTDMVDVFLEYSFFGSSYLDLLERSSVPTTVLTSEAYP
jgi:hypothetical protein